MSKISGIGIDIVEVERFRKVPYAKDKNFYKKIFTDREIKYCLSKTDPAQHFAARFAAKEAVLKCLKSTIYKIKEIEIVNDKKGVPSVRFHSRKLLVVPTQSRILDPFKIGTSRFLISLSHTRDYAAAAALFVN